MRTPRNVAKNKVPGEEDLGITNAEEHFTTETSELGAEAIAGSGFNDGEHAGSVSFGESPGGFPELTAAAE